MALYARTPWRQSWQLVGDVGVVVWIVVWWLVSRTVTSAIDGVAEPARRTVQGAERLRADFAAAADSAGGVPLAGADLRLPFDSATTSMDQVIAAAQDQVNSIEQLAFAGGVLVLAIPVSLLLALWLPARLQFVNRTRAMRGLIDSYADMELLALRALSNQPIKQVAQISPDPVGDVRAGRWPVVVALAELELGSVGLSVPSELRRRGDSERESAAATGAGEERR